MKVFKGIFIDTSWPANDMNGSECIAIEIGAGYQHVSKAPSGDYSRCHQSEPFKLPMLKPGYVELVEKEEVKEILALEPEKKLSGLNEFFGQELKALNVEFK